MRVRFAKFGQKGAVCLLAALALLPGSAAAAGIEARDITAPRGVSTQRTITYGSAWVDHDLDGDVDLFVNRHWKRPWFYTARRTRYELSGEDFVSLPGYEDTTPATVDRHHCMWGEANGDGRPDFYCTVGAQRGRGRGANQLAMRTRRGWVDRAETLGLADELGRGRSANWVDYDSDGDLDLFIANGKRDGHPNKLFRNERGSFRLVGVGVRDELRSLTSSWADWDADGDLDLLVTRGNITSSRVATPVAYTNEEGRFVRQRLPVVTTQRWISGDWADVDGDGLIDIALVRKRRVRVLRNLGGRFTELYQRRLARGRSLVWLDWDNDSDLDLFVVQGAPGKPNSATNRPDILLINTGLGFRRVVKAPLRGPRRGNGEAATVSDFDRDGRVDLFVTNGNDPSAWRGRSTLLRNTSSVGNWAGVDLYGGRWNPVAIGATVEVESGAGRYWRFADDGSGYKSQSEIGYVHLGLGRFTTAVVTVHWPEGGKDCAVVRAGRIRKVAKGDARCSP